MLMTTQEKIAVMQAYVDGKQIQIRTSKGWIDFYITAEPSWNWRDFEYRIKPEPKEPTYRPYKNFDEFRADWGKHGGWVITVEGDYALLYLLRPDAEYNQFEKYKWADDNTPCGIKVEE